MIEQKHTWNKTIGIKNWRIDFSFSWGFDVLEIGVYILANQFVHYEFGMGLLNLQFRTTIWRQK